MVLTVTTNLLVSIINDLNSNIIPHKCYLPLPYSTGRVIPNSTTSVKSASNGAVGIFKAIRTLAVDIRVGGGYYPYVIIQPRIIDNRETKIACFNGKATMKV